MTHRSRLTAISIDVPADVHEVATRFWRSAFGSDHDGPAQAGYASIGRERGLDAFIQALDAGGPRIDLDIETDDVDAEVRRLEALGGNQSATGADVVGHARSRRSALLCRPFAA